MSDIAIVCAAGAFFGKETIALELGQGMRESGRQVEFISSLWGDGCFRNRAKADGFPVRLMRLGFISATLRLDCLWWTLDQLLHWPGLVADYRRFLRESRPKHIVHTNWQHLLLLMPWLNPQRDYFWVHESVPNKAQYRCVLGRLSRRIRCFIAISNSTADSLRSLGIPEEKIRVIYNGIRDPVPPTGIPARDTNSLRIGVGGQMNEHKGQADLVAAFGLLATAHPAAELHIFGRGTQDYEKELKRRVGELGLTSRVFWRGYVAERHMIFSDVDIFVVPSRFAEPFGLIAVEAAFFGLPVVASRRGGIPDIIEEGVTGFLVEAENPSQLAERLDELLRNTDLRKKMGTAARQRAQTCFGREIFVQNHLCLLDGPTLTNQRP